ncbi:PREDICTED: phospholipase B1, membrane-associated-like [Amphimedon queenslandica]|uniref:Phospholipase B1, membrane-associated n=1 Tax=Amphimedon queenslandica TaxID=400682 RepID=A0A1X7VXG5_AMPQE|nr:PREDICTED: phospholipase B1, membrane-associated-like [Amphimedon queenslandica]|eukprot:XP_019849320.1 PREDICTED: phospholipase B1, membrane-associated-like [Amphimedon queenslandica]
MEVHYLLVLLSLSGLLSFAVAVEDGYEERLREALKKAQEQVNASNATLGATCYKRFGHNFDCELFPHDKKEPATVHELTPYDISYIGALGDSITAAMGSAACTVLDDLISYRGQSWTIGGRLDLKKITSIPNILRKYNPNLKGFSTGNGGPNSGNAKNNVAVIGAIAQDMPDQAKELVKRMKESMSEDDFNNKWKLVSLWIGGNNLCSYCKKREKHSPENYVNSITAALDILKEELPRTFVNLIQIIDVTRLEPLKGPICDLVHYAVCECTLKDLEETSRASTEYQEGLADLVNSGRYDDRDDFTVVLQPFMEGVELPRLDNGKPDFSYFAPDCFHFSSKGHMEGAIALWKNMFEPVGSKTSGWDLPGKLYCPTEDNKYLFTKKNSPPPSLFGQSGTEQSAGVTTEGDKATHSASIAVSASIGAVSLLVVVIIVIVIAFKLRNKRRARGIGEQIPLFSNN